MSRATVHRLRSLLDALRSGELAIGLLLLSVLLLLASIGIPQVNRAGEAGIDEWVKSWGWLGSTGRTLGLTDLSRSWLAQGTAWLLAVNVSLCMVRRIPAALRRLSFRDGPSICSFPRAIEVGRSVPPREVAAVLARHGYRVRIEQHSVTGQRGRLSLAGHWIFHFGLLVALVSVAVAFTRPPSFRGQVGIGEGEPFAIHSAPFLATNRPVDGDLPDLRFQVERIDVATSRTEVRAFEATIATPEGEVRRLAVNRPYRAGPYQVLPTGFGYMPGWTIVDSQNRMVAGAWVKLMPFPFPQEDSFPIGPDGCRVDLTFYPDYGGDEAEEHSGGYELGDSRFRASISWHGREVFSGLLTPGRSVPLERGLWFSFLPSIRRYTQVDVIDERGSFSIVLAFGLMIAGLALRYGRHRKELRGEQGEGGTRLRGWSEMFPSLLEEELRRLAGEMRRGASR